MSSNIFLTEKIYKFERMRLGKKTVTESGMHYPPYLYRNLIDNTLLASYDKPKENLNYLYKGEQIGYNTDAILYYKNY